MKLACSKNELISLVSKADKLIGKNVNLPALSFIKLSADNNSLKITSTNLDLGFVGQLDCEVKESGTVLVSGSVIFQFISNLGKNDNKVVLEKEGNNLFIKSENAQSKINLQPDEDFPTLPEIKTSKKVEIDSKSFIEGIRSVWYSASTSSIKPELSSIYIYHNLGELVFVATDSYRLAEKRVKIPKIEEFETVLIPYRNATEIVRIFEDMEDKIKIFFDEDQIKIESENITLLSRVVDGNFPDYKQIIPKDFETKIHVLKQDFAQANKIANIFVDKQNQITINIDSKDRKMSIFSKSSERGDSENSIKIKPEGPDVKINLNGKYITDCLNSIEDDNLIIELNGSTKPMVIKSSKDNGFTYLVMPMNK